MNGLTSDIAGTPARAIKQYKDDCLKCNGTGRYIGRSQYGSECFACNGQGYLMFATSPEARAKSRRYAAASRVKKSNDNWNAYEAENPEAAKLLLDRQDSFEFAASMIEAIRKYGSLTENQAAAVQRMVDRQRQYIAERAQREQNPTAVAEDKIGEALKRAASSGIRYPKMVFAGFRFSLAPKHGRNAGAVYVKSDDDTYLGKAINGQLIRSRDCTHGVAESIAEVMANPSEQARLYGQRTGICCCCNRELTNPASIEAGIGPICADRYGL